jgi:hypothetical protein
MSVRDMRYLASILLIGTKIGHELAYILGRVMCMSQSRTKKRIFIFCHLTQPQRIVIFRNYMARASSVAIDIHIRQGCGKAGCAGKPVCLALSHL